MYQRKVDVDMLNAVKSVLADISSVSPQSEQRAKSKTFCSDEGLTLETSANTLFTAFSIYPHQPTLMHCTFYHNTDADQH